MRRRLVLVALALLAPASCRGGDEAPPPPSAVEAPPAPATAATTPEPDGAEAAPRWCPPPATAWPDSLAQAGFLAGDAMESRPETAEPTPWEKMFGAAYIGPQDIALDERGRIFLCSGVDELVMLDASEPAQIRPRLALKPSVSLPELEPETGMAVLEHRAESYPNAYGRCEQLELAGDRLYFSHRGDFFRPRSYVAAYDLTQTPPTLVGVHAPRDRSLEGLAASGPIVFVAQHGDGLGILHDTGSSLERLAELTGAETLDNAWDVAISGHHAYVADGGRGVAVVDFGAAEPSAAAGARIVGRLVTGGHVKSLEVDAERRRLYVAAGRAGLVIASLDDPAAPRVLGRADTPGSVTRVAPWADRVAVADWNDARLFDVRDPTQPLLLGVEHVQTDKPNSRTVSVALRDDVLVLGEWFGVHTLRVDARAAAPDLEVREELVDVGTVAPGEASTRTIRLDNVGGRPLTLGLIRPSDPTFTATPASATIAPRSHLDVAVTFTPTGPDTVLAFLVLCSDDPDEHTTLIKLRGNSAWHALGAAAPEVRLGLLDGTPWRLSEQRGQPVLLAYFANF